jgi:hypothetical protein
MSDVSPFNRVHSMITDAFAHSVVEMTKWNERVKMHMSNNSRVLESASSHEDIHPRIQPVIVRLL